MCSVALLLQYEAVARREAVSHLRHSGGEQTNSLIIFALLLEHQAVYFAWRPQLADPNDEFILDLAVAAGRQIIL